MTKTKRIYQCQTCSNESLQWSGQCSECKAWNSFIEIEPAHHSKKSFGYAGVVSQDHSVELHNISLTNTTYLSTDLEELNRVLGQGIVPGSVVLLGGDPGIGKSTLLLQMLHALSQKISTLYVSGEESLQQIAMRAKRLNITSHPNLKLFAATHIESILELLHKEQPKILIIDSIQTIYTDKTTGAPGSLTQLKECTAYLTRYAKQTETALFLTGHVNKEGALAGPRVLEHMVDTVLYFEGETYQKLRFIRAIKNRFGPINELGVFAMTDKGLKEIKNPSAILLSRPDTISPGSLITTSWEGNRPLLVELQALVDTSHLSNPRRVAVGLDASRLAMLLAVLHRHGGIKTYDQDIFINVVGGVRILETSGVDLPVLLTILSSFYNRTLPKNLMAFGEVGLSGEIRPVTGGQERLQAALKHGFTCAVIPESNTPKKNIPGLEIIPITNLNQAIQHLF